MICYCSSFEKPDGKLRFCADHHRFFIDDRELPSVTKVLKACWPVKPNFAAAPPDVLENARQRGSDLDALCSAYVAGTLDRIPKGTREDVKELFLKAQPWFDEALKTGPLKTQERLTDGNIAGITDFTGAAIVFDLKGTYDIEPYYPVQVGGYIQLYEAQYQRKVEAAGILHVTARLTKPRWIPLDPEECLTDWKILRRTWEMAQRRLRPLEAVEKQ
jgi:hypothetical protein